MTALQQLADKNLDYKTIDLDNNTIEILAKKSTRKIKTIKPSKFTADFYLGCHLEIPNLKLKLSEYSDSSGIILYLNIQTVLELFCI